LGSHSLLKKSFDVKTGQRRCTFDRGAAIFFQIRK
jgi:hypothetical protein